MNKEEILENIAELLPNFIYKNVDKKQVLSYISKSLEEYADWKIKECLGEYEKEDTIDIRIESNEAETRNKFRDQILINKDKK